MAAAPVTSDPADPAERWSSSIVLGDGESVLVRPIRPDDAPALAAFHRRQSHESIYRRFFSPKPTLSDADLEHFTNVDMVDRAALVVERYGEFVAWASYERWAGRDDADAAFQVDDGLQGKGIATLLLEHLAAIARANGIVRFTAEVLAENRPMLAVFAGRDGRSSGASTAVSSTSTSRSRRPTSSSTPWSGASSVPTRGRSPGCCSRGRSP